MFFLEKAAKQLADEANSSLDAVKLSKRGTTSPVSLVGRVVVGLRKL